MDRSAIRRFDRGAISDYKLAEPDYSGWPAYKRLVGIRIFGDCHLQGIRLLAIPIDLWLIHPEEEKCDAFRVRFEGLPMGPYWQVKMSLERYKVLFPGSLVSFNLAG